MMVSNLEVSSPVIKEGKRIPSDYTCDSIDESPELRIGGIPDGTASIALIVEDPDAPGGTFTHWVLFNLPPESHKLERGMSLKPVLENGAKQGKNSGGTIGYIGPCPPKGSHRYYFNFFALDSMLDLDAGISSAELKKAMEGHIIAQGKLMGVYAR